MPLTVRNSAGRRRKTPDEKLPDRPGESTSAQVMAPTRMKLRVRRRDVAGGAQQAEEEERSRDGGGSGGGRSSNRRKNATNASTTAAAASSPPTSSSSATARVVVAAEDTSPDSKCPICLDRFNNLAYLDRCLHRFCFPCIQEWSHNKAECPLCKQPFASILHSVRAEDDFKEYTLRPAPANSSVAATVAMVAAMASAARSDHQMRLMLRRHRVDDDGSSGGGEATTRRWWRDRGGRGSGRRAGMWEWYLDSPPLPLPPLSRQSAVTEDGGEAEEAEQQRRGGTDGAERGVIFEGLTGLGGTGSVAADDRASRRLMTRLAARRRLQQEGGAVRRLRERETVAFRRGLYRCGVRVSGVAGGDGNEAEHREVTAESFRRNPAHLHRLRPWLRRELTVLYGSHATLVDIVQRIIMAQLARHGLEDTPTVEEELRPFLLARTDHFLHELLGFARSPLGLDAYDLQAVYEPLGGGGELSSVSDSSSVIAISEGEEEEETARGGGAHDDVIQTGSSLSLSAWDDETPGPSYSTAAEPSCSLSLSPAPQEASNQEAEEECLIVGYKKPIAERTPELVQLSSDTEDDDKKMETLPPPLATTTTTPLSYLPTIPPSTSGAFREEQDDKSKENDNDGEMSRCLSRARSWSGSSECTLSGGEQQQCQRDRKQPDGEAARERRRKRKRRRRERSGVLFNPNRSIYPAMMRRRSRSPSPFCSSVESGSPLPPSPPDSSWERRRSPLSCSASSLSHSSSSSSSSSPLPQTPQTPPTPSLSPGDTHHREKPGGKRKYKSRHLDSNDKDPTWRPSGGSGGSHRRERRKEKERRRRRERLRESGGRESSNRKRRDDRSPSVEIIYEGTVGANDVMSSARKRQRRKRHHRMALSSSPVIITLDSDSSHDGVGVNKVALSSGSSSPLSSQQTVDFSDLPPLPLVNSAAVGGALDAEIGELPVDILDRGSASDGSETELTGRSRAAAAGRNISDVSDVSDQEVDVENVEEGGANEARVDDCSHIRKCDVTASDSRLLASILNDLKGISASKPNLSVTYDPNRSPDGRKRRRTDSPRDGSDLPPRRTFTPPPPPLKERSPVQLYNRNTPPPLKHKDAGSPRSSPPPADLNPNAVVTQTIPSISTLKKHFSLASTSGGGSCDSLPRLDFLDTFPSTLHSSCDITMETPSSGPVNFHPVNSLPPADFRSAPSPPPPPSDSTSGCCRDLKTFTQNSCRVASVDLCLTPPGGAVFSGADANDSSSAGLAPPLDTRTRSPSSFPDSAPSPVHLRLKRPEDTMPPADVCSRLDAAAIDGHLNHTALPPSVPRPPHGHDHGRLGPAPDPHVPSDSQPPGGAVSKTSRTDNHIMTPFTSNQWNNANANANVDHDGVWTTHTHTQTQTHQ